MKYRPEIDGLRALAVIPVILFHAGFDFFKGGFVGVDVFFVISGYLITTLLIEDIENKKFSIANFYERRARRILPALFVVIVSCLPFAWMWLTPSQMKDFSQSLIAVGLFASNILFWRESGYFDTATEEKPLLHTWSLAVEEQYYLIFPIFLILFWRFGRNKVFWIIILTALCSLLLSEWGWRNKPTANFYLIPTRAWELLTGSIVAFILKQTPVKKNNILSLIGLSMIVGSIFVYDESTPFPSLYALAPVIGTALIILFSGTSTITGNILTNKLFISIGLVSYSAYLWHQPLFAFARIKLIEEPSALLMGALSVLSLALAYLSCKFVEKPFRKGNIIDKKTLISLSLSGLFVIILFGLSGHISNGFEESRSKFTKYEEIVKEAFHERIIHIRSGICHFNRKGKYSSLNDFLNNWSCTDDDEGLVKSGILLTGDSHSADKAVSLRQAGYDVYQIAGAGCPLSPLLIKNERTYCRKILKKSKKISTNNNIKAVFLSSRFEKSELTEDYLSSIVEYWSDIKKPIYIFSPMPVFKESMKAFLHGSSKKYNPDYSREDLFYSSIKKLTIPSNFHIIKTSDFWCPRNTDDITCYSYSEERVLMADEDHLSLKGSMIFGNRLTESSDLSWLFR